MSNIHLNQKKGGGGIRGNKEKKKRGERLGGRGKKGEEE